MTDLSHVTICASSFEYIFEPLEPELVRRGFTVSRYKTTAQLAADPEVLAATEVLFVVGTPCTRALMESMPLLRAILSPITGTDAIDEKAATDLGIIVGNGQTPENAESMAESTILLILASLYDLHAAEALLRENRPEPIPPSGTMLRGKLLGLIGFGGIARGVQARLAPWKVRFQTYTPRLREPLPEGVARVELDALMATSDVITLLTPLNAETRGMLDARRLGLAKKGAVFVNAARGGIVDEEALYKLASEGHYAKIACDVFATEPLPPDSKLRLLPNAILTPHMLGHTREALTAFVDTALENAMRVLHGRLPVYVRNPAIAEAWQAKFD